jgi:O-antigen/teichoic acid export membrane protein
MSEASTIVQELPAATPKRSSFRATVFSNIVASIFRVIAVSLVALFLPAYLTHHLSVQTYSAWVLIIQLAAYVSYLDIGIQTAVSKFVAEYCAANNRTAASRHASAGLVLMTVAGTLGLGLAVFLAWRVPSLFAAMPASLYHDVRVSILLVGASLSFGLVCAVYSAVFFGLQRYWVPTTITIINRASFTAIVITVVALRGSLVAMGIGVALVNVLTGIIQVAAWRSQASEIRLSFRLAEYAVLQRVMRFCAVQSIWIGGMLCVSGLDIAIVGHYDYVQTAYYSIATMPTSFVLLIMSSLLNPLMPASSALSTKCSPSQMGEFLARFTRYTAIMLLLTGLPLMVCGYSILRAWVGPDYAIHTLPYLRILVFANVVRNWGAPYATMITAIGRQETGTVAAVSEAAVNLGSSLYLASRLGAIGVALGTMLGAFVSVLLHFTITMRFTGQAFAISRARLFLRGVVQPFAVAIPSLLFFPLWWPSRRITLSPGLTVVWGTATLAMAWYFALSGHERKDVKHLIGNYWPPAWKAAAG